MKDIIKTRENWLLIVPLLIWLVEKTMTGTSTLDFHLQDTYFVIANVSIGFIFLALAVLPFFCHKMLRSKVNKNTKLLLWHVLLTCIAVIVFFFFDKFFSYEGMAGAPRRYYDYKSWNNYFISYSEIGIVVVGLIYLLLQVSLLLYAIVRLIRK